MMTKAKITKLRERIAVLNHIGKDMNNVMLNVIGLIEFDGFPPNSSYLPKIAMNPVGEPILLYFHKWLFLKDAMKAIRDHGCVRPDDFMEVKFSIRDDDESGEKSRAGD